MKRKKLITIWRNFIKSISEEESHWSEDWDKAEYRILKKYNDNGNTTYRAQRMLHKGWENLVGNRFPCDNESDAIYLIRKDREFYEKEWMKRATENVEIIPIIL